MTAIVGILCREGVVIGTDSAATFSVGTGAYAIRTIEAPSKKIEVIDDRIIVAPTGEIGLGQRFCHYVSVFSQEKKFGKDASHIQVASELANQVLNHFRTTGIQLGQVGFGCLLAFPLGSKLHLCEFPAGAFQPEFKTKELWFSSMGSGQAIIDPFLAFLRKIFWPRSNAGLPTLSSGIFLATWALTHAIELNPGGINGPIQLATLTNLQDHITVKMLSPSEIFEHETNVKAAENHLADYRKELQKEAGQGIQIPDPAEE